MVVRQYPRFPATFSGTLVHQNRVHRISKALDLSRKGCRLESSFHASAGMRVDLLIYVPEEATPILVRNAVVRWTGARGIGIEFDSLAPSHQDRLNSVIQRLEATVGHT